MESKMTFCPLRADKIGPLRTIFGASLLAMFAFATSASAQDVAPLSQNPASQSAASEQTPPPGETSQGGYPDPFAPFNDAMFTFNLKLDDWVLRPVASGYASIAPVPVRESLGRFFDNTSVIPRFA